MGESFLSFMKQLGIFIICAQSLIHFTAGREYEKYIKVLIGMMLLAQFVTPLRAALSDESAVPMWEEVERFQLELDAVMKEAETAAEEASFSSDLSNLSEEKIAALLGNEEAKEVSTGEGEVKNTVKIEAIKIKAR